MNNFMQQQMQQMRQAAQQPPANNRFLQEAVMAQQRQQQVAGRPMGYQPSAVQQRASFEGSFQPPLTHQSSSATTNSVGENFRVAIRVRPPLPKEQENNCPFQSIVSVSQDNKSVSIMEYLGAEVNEREKQRDIESNPHLCVWQHFTFDAVYDEDSSQEFVYENFAKMQVESVLEGYNATILAYGQTGAGKTYTMEGFKYSSTDPQRGIVPRSMEEIFRFIQMQQNKNTTFMVRASYLQIYNETISDLLKAERTSLTIREDKKKGVFVEGLSEWAVRSSNEVYSLMQRGALSRETATTKANPMSSRSHAVFMIIVEQMTTITDENGGSIEEAPKQIRMGKLNLVDLAGSERVMITGASGKNLVEAQNINKSLLCLGNVINALTGQKGRTHIPYRDSKLTRLLEDSLGGNCKTTLMAMITPAAEAFDQSVQTLKFATRAKKVKNQARINEDVDQKALLRKYEIELRRLKSELANKNQNMIEAEHYLQLENDKRRAEEDKAAAITALEARSREYIMEKEHKKMLEDKIRTMNSQLLIGGKKIEDTPQFRSALEAKQKLIRQEYETKLQEIERERTQIEEDKAQVDRYKQLLLKQRDIMIALTSRLNERDETIIQLQEELDAYDRIHRETEQIIESKNQRVFELESFIMEKCGQEVPTPQFNEQEYPQLMNQRLPHEHQERKYDAHPGLSNSVEGHLLTADEKVEELNHVLTMQQDQMQQMQNDLAQREQDKIKFVREKIDDLVNKEVQLKLNNVAVNGGVASKTLEVFNPTSDEELNQSREQMSQMISKMDSMNQEKQAFYLLASDVQGIVGQAMQDLGQVQNDPYRLPAVNQKLNEIGKLIGSMQKHLQMTSQQQPRTGNSSHRSESGKNSVQPSPSGNKGYIQPAAGSQNYRDPNEAQIVQQMLQQRQGLPPTHQQRGSNPGNMAVANQQMKENNVMGGKKAPQNQSGTNINEMIRKHIEAKQNRA